MPSYCIATFCVIRKSKRVLEPVDEKQTSKVNDDICYKQSE
jgi:hypothetical protein